jgi:ABC-type glycerol-3-phosphate transport system substrate-binding protein
MFERRGPGVEGRKLTLNDRSLRALALAVAMSIAACGQRPDVLTFSGSVLGGEGEIVRRQIARYAARHPELPIEVRPTPDAADQRHQLYVEWLNAWAADPDVLQLDVVWTPEFAAAGWILPLDPKPADEGDFFDAAIDADTWRGRLYAVPWFVDAGMLYWRTDLMPSAPETFEDLTRAARAAVARGAVSTGFVWQGARYEGLVTVFLEYLTGFGGRILQEDGSVSVDGPAAVRALTAMRDAISRDRIVPPAALTWQEEQTRFAFQNGRAAFMRNWPYAAALLARPPESAVAGRFAVAPMPHEQGRSAATLGGAQLAINARSRQPAAARALIDYLTAPGQMLERAQAAGQFPARRSVYRDPRLRAALPIPPERALAIVEHAVPRPVTPVYTQLSGILQVHLHRALSDQEDPSAALSQAAAEMRHLLATAGLTKGAA